MACRRSKETRAEGRVRSQSWEESRRGRWRRSRTVMVEALYAKLSAVSYQLSVVSCQSTVSVRGAEVRGAQDDGAEAGGLQFFDKVGEAGDVALEVGGAAADVFALVGVAGGDGGEAETSADLGGEGVLTVAAAAVVGLDRLHVGVSRISDGAFEGVGPVAVVTQLEGGLPPVGTGRDYSSACVCGPARQFGHPVHAVDEA